MVTETELKNVYFPKFAYGVVEDFQKRLDEIEGLDASEKYMIARMTERQLYASGLISILKHTPTPIHGVMRIHSDVGRDICDRIDTLIKEMEKEKEKKEEKK